MGAAGLETPAVPSMVGAPGGMTPDQWHADKAAREMYERNRPLSDEELDGLLPGAEEVGKHVDTVKSHPCSYANTATQQAWQQSGW